MKTSGKRFIPEGNVPEWKRYFGFERTEVCLFELLQLIIFTIEIMLREPKEGWNFKWACNSWSNI